MLSISEYLQDKNTLEQQEILWNILEGNDPAIPDDSNYIKQYERSGEKGLWSQIKRYGKKLGKKLLFGVLLLYYALTELHDKGQDWGDITRKIKTALGYFLMPVDLILDNIPVFGWVDDLIVVVVVVDYIAKNYPKIITPEVKQKAHDKFCEWFPEDVDDDVQHWKSEMENVLN